MNPEKTGNFINELRSKLNLTQKALAEKINVTDKAVSKWERGDGFPDISVMQSLAEVLGVSVEEIMNGELNKPLQDGNTVLTQEQLRQMGLLEPEREINGKKLKLYDFKRPDVISKSQMREIWQAGEKLQTHIADKINFTTKPTSSWICCVDELNNTEFLNSIPANCFCYNYHYAEGGLAIGMDGQLGKAILKQDYEKYPDVTESDVQLLYDFYIESLSENLFKILYGKTTLCEQNISFENFRLPLKECTNYPRSIYVEPYGMAILLSLEVEVAETKGYINIVFSLPYINQLVSAGFFKSNSGPKWHQLNSINKAVAGENLTVEFGRFSGNGLELVEGEILIMDKNCEEPLNLVHNNKVIHKVAAGVLGEYMAAIIQEDKLKEEENFKSDDYLSVELGRAVLSKDELEGLKKDSVIELDSYTGEACKITRNGKFAAEGEICIADTNFAIRINKVY